MQTVLQTENYNELLDSLPYVDFYNEHMQHQVDVLIKEEMRKFAPPDYLAQLPCPKVFKHIDENTVIVKNEFERIANREPMRPLDTTRYKCEPPPKNKSNDADAWQLAIDNAQAQLEHQYLRLINLELLNNYGANTWKLYNTNLETVHRNVTKMLDQYKSQIEQINIARKNEQEATGNTIRGLEAKWNELWHKNLEVETACLVMESDIEQLKQQLSDSNETTTNN